MIEVKSVDDLRVVDKFFRARKLDFDKIEDKVREIVRNVRENGDEALFEYIKKFDGFVANKNNIRVKSEEIDDAVRMIPQSHKDIIKCALGRIEKFHRSFLPKSSFIEEDGAILGNRITPVESAGLYIPGGKAVYPSTALMTIIPAVVAGVKSISIATPAKEGVVNPYVLYISYLYGIEKIYKMGGAHAIAALAYSTDSIDKVDVIAGPGNAFVALAKKLVFGQVGIDSIAGPSEVMIVADETSNANYIAYDLLSQAEHDELAGCFFVGLDKGLVEEVESKFFYLASKAKREKIVKQSARNAMFVYTDSLDLASLLVDNIAPEHLEIQVKDPYMFLNKIRNAGAIFIGNFTPEPIGDYVAGPNHTLPTFRTARFFSPLSCDTFLKKSSLLHFSKEGFLSISKCASDFANLEGLFAHKDSIDVRSGNI